MTKVLVEIEAGFQKVEPYFQYIGLFSLAVAGFFALHYKRIYIPLMIGLAFILFSRYLAGKAVTVPKL